MHVRLFASYREAAGTGRIDLDLPPAATVRNAVDIVARRHSLATDGRALPPKDGDLWRMDFSRFNTYKEAPPAHDSGGWFWTHHGIWDSHIPECFVNVTFSTNAVSLGKTPTTRP